MKTTEILLAFGIILILFVAVDIIDRLGIMVDLLVDIRNQQKQFFQIK